MSRILEALARVDRERDATEGSLREQIRHLTTHNAYLTEQLRQAASLLSKRTLAIALMLGRLQALGMSREEIDALTAGNLDLSEEQSR